jgi:hypothetical protein
MAGAQPLGGTGRCPWCQHMLLEHLGLDVLISLPKLPPDWEQTDVF